MAFLVLCPVFYWSNVMVKMGRAERVFRNRRSKQFNFKLTPEDKASLFRAARSVRKSVAAYLLALHYYAVGAGKEDSHV